MSINKFTLIKVIGKIHFNVFLVIYNQHFIYTEYPSNVVDDGFKSNNPPSTLIV